jgi:uncharacterized protein (TIGR00730 family)
MRRLCVFCGSNVGGRPEYAAGAREFAAAAARRGLGLVYGGGNIGLMGVVADAALEAGGEVIGVIPSALQAKELAHAGLTELHVVRSMHERKALMADLSNGFAALPGGFGTLEELFEILTWAQLGIHAKPVGLLDTAGFFQPLLALLDHQVEERFLKPRHRALVHVAADPERLLDMLLKAPPAPAEPKWLDESRR